MRSTPPTGASRLGLPLALLPFAVLLAGAAAGCGGRGGGDGTTDATDLP